ncbi:hypothetical protein LV779_01770 [Streptomyces thinghirensis]|nr:hypothetical protein [Streptomyces thinghirensis]
MDPVVAEQAPAAHDEQGSPTPEPKEGGGHGGAREHHARRAADLRERLLPRPRHPTRHRRSARRAALHRPGRQR